VTLLALAMMPTPLTTTLAAVVTCTYHTIMHGDRS
jgi:hypothetical protein